MNAKKMLLSVTIMPLATTPLDHMIVSVTLALKLIQLVYTSVHNSPAQFVLISTSVAMKTQALPQLIIVMKMPLVSTMSEATHASVAPVSTMLELTKLLAMDLVAVKTVTNVKKV
jgi:hypothetical protein